MTKKIIANYPSNIALVKYWGKYGNQLPCNPSLSMTLSQANTKVELTLSEKTTKQVEFDYFFEGQSKDSFKSRILNYAQQQKEYEQLLANFALRIDSSNTFPHSTGIASSASAFAAISAALLKASSTLSGEDFLQSASNLARLGSGSACRSFYGPYATWGEIEGLPQTSNEYATPITDIHPDFLQMKDAILIVEDEPKKVSSSVGHSLMNNHPFAESRFLQAKQHVKDMLSTLKSGDFNQFISITEREALSLHSMMMTSNEYYMLMKPGTVAIIEQIFQFRKDTGLPVCFTLDAGPNIHLLYPESIEKQINEFIANTVKSSYKSVLFDHSGIGGTIQQL